MVNSQVVSEIIESFKLDRYVDKIPAAIPVIEVSPKLLQDTRNASGVLATSGVITVLSGTLNPTTRVRLKTIIASIIKDATCDVATGSIGVTATMGGTSKNLISIPVITLTAQEQSIAISFPNPILIDVGTSVLMSGTFTAGAMVRTCNLSYIVDETI